MNKKPYRLFLRSRFEWRRVSTNWNGFLNVWNLHYVKSAHIRIYSGLYFPAFRLNTDQNNSEYGHFSCGVICRGRTYGFYGMQKKVSTENVIFRCQNCTLEWRISYRILLGPTFVELILTLTDLFILFIELELFMV